MSGNTPARIDDAPRSFIGVGSRELGISAVGIVLAVLIFMAEGIILPIRVALAIIIAGAALGLAFGRDPQTGRRFEEMIVDWAQFQGRDKFHQKGAGHVEEMQRPKETPKPKKPKPIKDSKPRKTYFKVQPIDLNFTYVFQVCSLALLGVILAYLWGGGFNELVFKFESYNGNTNLNMVDKMLK